MVEIYWDDLTEEKQREILEMFGDNQNFDPVPDNSTAGARGSRRLLSLIIESMTGGYEDVSSSFVQ